MNVRVLYSLVVVLLISSLAIPATVEAGNWELAQENKDTLRFSTLFTAQNVRKFLQSDEGLDEAVAWCKQCGITHVYLETFRNKYLVPMAIVQKAKKRFEAEGMRVSGCITTVGIGRESVNGWIFPCFTEPGGLENLKHIFQYTAMLFDEIMIDDFFATQCQCEDCMAGKGDRSWPDFRNDLMVEVSKTYVIDPVKQVNPDCQIIIKYPQWYSDFQDKGYDIDRQTALFDRTWVGTETRDPDNSEWGRHPQYMAYFIMRWLGVNGKDKCGGGWFDPYGTSPATYVEQARQTILGGADEALLFCYGSLQENTGPGNVDAFRQEVPALFELAALIKNKPIRGIHAPKAPNSVGAADRYMYDFLGMLGLPLAPADGFDPDALSAVLGHPVLSEPNAVAQLTAYRDTGRPALVTDTLMKKLPKAMQDEPGSMQVLSVPDDKWAWMDLDGGALNDIRNALLRPLGVQMNAPSRVALYLFGDDVYGIENFNDAPVEVRLTISGSRVLKPVLVIKKGQDAVCSRRDGAHLISIPARTLVMLK